jgi:hypothetical protein
MSLAHGRVEVRLRRIAAIAAVLCAHLAEMLTDFRASWSGTEVA